MTALLADGAPVKHGDIAFTVEGPARSILTAERLVLNCMQRMSGIATYTAHLTPCWPAPGPSCWTPAKPRPTSACARSGPCSSAAA